MSPLQPGAAAPPIPGVDPGVQALVFYKVTCPTCQLAGPVVARLSDALGARFASVVQDPPDRAEGFAERFGPFPFVTDEPPYEASDAYGIRTVPTLFVIERGRVAEVVESWNRDAWNAAGERLGAGVLSPVGDGLPPFRPG